MFSIFHYRMSGVAVPGFIGTRSSWEDENSKFNFSATNVGKFEAEKRTEVCERLEERLKYSYQGEADYAVQDSSLLSKIVLLSSSSQLDQTFSAKLQISDTSGYQNVQQNSEPSSFSSQHVRPPPGVEEGSSVPEPIVKVPCPQVPPLDGLLVRSQCVTGLITSCYTSQHTEDTTVVSDRVLIMVMV